MTAREIMSRQFEFVHPDAPIDEVARKMATLDLEPLPVCKDGCLVGLVSQNEVATRVAPARSARRPMRVRDVIAPDVVYCFENTEVNEAALLMREKRVRLLPVLSRNNRLVGLLALKDIPAETK